MAKCLIEACGIPVYTCRKDEPNGKFVDTIKKTFEVAAENAPAIVFLDDMDKFANTGYSQRDAEEFVAVQACIDANKEMWGVGYKDYGYNTSQPRKQKTEELVGAIVEKYNRKAKEIIAKNREFFDKLLKALLEKGMLVEGEIAAIRKTCKITPVAID